MTTEQISVRIDHATKAAAEGVFNVLGLSATDAIRMFYRQVALQRGLPFAAKIPNPETLAAIKELDAGKGKKTSLKEFKALLETIEK
ncbi:MAG: type II toxin-antitoxin system RelB/DinJ family antitoxin [Alphaproteobacteria bacterium]|nr:type II toxin-antitoxin system RelB/DinJ family antitoxin [Alphaproteobacteria bacterium]